MSTTWQIPFVVDWTTISHLLPAARSRELKKANDIFASHGRNVFTHYVTPILAKGREHLLASRTRKKRYHKSAAQLWPLLDSEQAFFWSAARTLRLDMKQGVLDREECIKHTGLTCERKRYVWFAELAVAVYLGLEQPMPLEDENVGKKSMQLVDCSPVTVFDELCLAPDLPKPITHMACKDVPVLNDTQTSERTADEDKAKLSQPGHSNPGLDPNHPLLDTLPDPFTCTQNQLFSHFALYDYTAILAAEGKHQTAMLRQLADRFDSIGKILFYYYAVPRLCQQTFPPSRGETVTGQAADIWRFLGAEAKEEWRLASVNLKRSLGDGDVQGLKGLMLEELEPGVLRLHGLAERAIKAHFARSLGDDEREKE